MKKIIFPILTLLILAIFAPSVLADTIDVSAGLSGTKEALGTSIQGILTGLAWFAGVIAVGALMFCGFQFMTAEDDKVRYNAKKHALWVLGGMAIISFSAMLVGYVATLVQ